MVKHMARDSGAFRIICCLRNACRRFSAIVRGVYLTISSVKIRPAPRSASLKLNASTQTAFEDEPDTPQGSKRRSAAAERRKRNCTLKKDTSRKDKPKKSSVVEKCLDQVIPQTNGTNGEENTSCEEKRESSVEECHTTSTPPPSETCQVNENEVMECENSSVRDHEPIYKATEVGDEYETNGAHPSENGYSSEVPADVSMPASVRLKTLRSSLSNRHVDIGPMVGTYKNGLSMKTSAPTTSRNSNHSRIQNSASSRVPSKQDTLKQSLHSPLFSQANALNRTERNFAKSASQNATYSAIVSGTAAATGEATGRPHVRHNEEPRMALPPGFGSHQSSMARGLFSYNNGASSFTHTPGLDCPVDIPDSRDQEMAPLIRSIIETVIPSESQDILDRPSLCPWLDSHRSRSIWGDHGFDEGASSSGYSQPENVTFPTFLRRSPERGDIGLGISQSFRAASLSNDYSYAGTDIWSTSAGDGFPPPIGTPWTPFRGPNICSQSPEPHKKQQ